MTIKGGYRKIGLLCLLYSMLFLLALVWIAPMVTLVLTAIKGKKEFFSGTGLFAFPQKIAWKNFSEALIRGRLLVYMKNDIIISGFKVPIGILVEAMAAYALTRLKMKNATKVFIFFLVGMMLPFQIALVPISVIYNKLRLINTYFGLFYVYVGFGISYGILVLRGFFRGIPKEMDEAAIVEGCTNWQIFIKVIMPMAKPAIATLLIVDFLATWNEYLLASVIINNNAKKTVPVGLMTFVGEHGTDYGFLCAGVLISVIPVLVVYLIFQRHFVEGMSGAVKS